MKRTFSNAAYYFYFSFVYFWYKAFCGLAANGNGAMSRS